MIIDEAFYDELIAKTTDPAYIAKLEIQKAFPGAVAHFMEPGGEFGASFKGKTVIAPPLEETALLAEVRALIAESKEKGRNLFLERWEHFEYEPGVDY